MLRGVFLSFSRASSWTMTSQAFGSLLAKKCWAYSMNNVSILMTWRWISR
jgi:hypothetical protein